jgi:hypothetical protein
MAFSGSDPILAKRRFFHAATIDAAIYQLAIAFFSWINQQGGKPDLQVVEFEHGTDAAQVICGAAAKLMALVLHKTTTTAAFAKISNHATDFSSAAVTVLVKQAAIQTDVVFFPKGLSHATGITIESHTTCDGSTTSAGTDGAAGVALIAAA